jgi:hypothetical protein
MGKTLYLIPTTTKKEKKMNGIFLKEIWGLGV